MLADAIAINPQSLDKLRFQATQDNGKESVRAAAQQFESYFLQMMLRTMRQTLSQDGPFDSQETRMFSDMFDQQVAQSISQSKGLGLADMLVEQLQASLDAGEAIKAAPRPYDLPSLPVQSQEETGSLPEPMQEPAMEQSDQGPLTPNNFVDRLWPHAVDAAASLGVSPHFLLAQAALESGWGKHETRFADGTNSYNLFNIKAGKSWDGARTSVATTEFVNGKPVQETAQFRAYGSYAEAFADYARLLKGNPRYAGAIAQGDDAVGFVRGLQSGGYATDPMYADKILRVMGSTFFRNGLAGAVQG
jgi:flagellar protein FlgJ